MENNQENTNTRNIDNKAEEEKVSNIEIALKEKQLILENSFKKLEEELQIHEKKIQEKLKVDKVKDIQEGDTKEDKLEQEKESKIAEVKSLIEQARSAAVAGHYDRAMQLLNDASDIIKNNPLLKGGGLESSIQRISSEIIEVQNGYISVNNIGNLLVNGLSEKEAEEYRMLLSNDMLNYYKSNEHKEKVQAARKDIEEGKEPPAPMLREYVNHTLEKDEKEKNQYIDRLALMVDHLDKKEKTKSLTKEEKEERKLYKEELKGARLDRAVHMGIRDLAQKETGRSDLPSLRTFVNMQLETEQGKAKIQDVVKQVRREIKARDNTLNEKREALSSSLTVDGLEALEAISEEQSNSKNIKDKLESGKSQQVKETKEQKSSSQEYLSPPVTPKVPNNPPGRRGPSRWKG
ncbi:hypothetical protein NOVO_09325 (plasmid) [Rickettsiales bacterium Ac37b]|nr:hypothetical protein NOVO_09325 [Rickettsiales bacterium Ac37b]